MLWFWNLLPIVVFFVVCADTLSAMLRVTTAIFLSTCRRMRLLLSVPASTLAPPNKNSENQLTVSSLCNLSVDIHKIRRFKAWVLSEGSAYVRETADLLRDMGADHEVIARILETHPEAFLCHPEDVAAQRDLWLSVCSCKHELVSIVEKFPASFFTLIHQRNQRDNILFLQSLQLNKGLIRKMMTSTPQIFSRPVESNQEVITTLKEVYLELGGNNVDVHFWLQVLLSQNPCVLLQPAQVWRDIVGFLKEQGFTTEELLSLVSSHRALVAELQPESMWLMLAFIESALDCSKVELKHIVIRCPDILFYSLPTMMGRFQALMDFGISTKQVKESPNVLELSTPVVLYRIHKLASYGYDVRSSSLDYILGTNTDWAKLNL